MKLEIIKIDKIIFEGEVSRIKAVSPGGHFEILDGHAPLVAALKAGPLWIEETRDDRGLLHTFDLLGGMMKVTPRKVVVLAE